jgi:hypothetical protein
MSTNKSNATEKKWETISVELIKLHLDLENYRHEPVENEENAIAKLYTHEKVEAIVRDIVEYGAISPLDRIGVIPMPRNPGHFIAVEGNRRMCALLLLNDPDRAPTPQARIVMREMAKQITLPNKIDVVKFGSKEQAKHWVDLRHLGPQIGQGLRTWNSSQKERAANEGGANQLALAVLDRAQQGKWLEGDKPPAITTLTRYLKNREVRAALGLGHHKDLVFTHDSNEADAALQQFLRDAMPTKDGSLPRVNSRSKDTDRSTYARDLRDRGVSPRTPLKTPAAPAAAKPGKVRTTAKPRNKPDTTQRKYLVPTGFVCNAEDRNLRMLFREMQRTPIDQHEFANAYLLRAFVERVMTLYLKKVDRGFTVSNDQALVRRCSQQLDPSSKQAKLKALRTAASQTDASHSLHTLGAAVHAGMVMDRRALIFTWTNWEYALELMLAAISTP